VALVEFHELTNGPTYDYGNFFHHLDRYLMLTGADQTEFRSACEHLRDELLRERVSHVGNFQPAYLEAYLNGLIGITYLAEDQKPPSARRARPYLENADREVKRLLNRGSAAVASAIAICEALLSRDEYLEVWDQVRSTLRALERFAEARALAAGGEGDTASKYRFAVNYSECAVQAYWLYTRCTGADRAKFRRELLPALRRVLESVHLRDLADHNDPATIGEDRVFELLFETALRAIDKGALAVRVMSADHGAHPALNLIRFYLYLAFTIAQVNRHLPEKLEVILPLPQDFPAHDTILAPLRAAVAAWRTGPDRLPTATARQLVEELPGRADWVHQIHLDASYDEALAPLDGVTCEPCATCPGRPPAEARPPAAGASR
jgi:hypothetical protein